MYEARRRRDGARTVARFLVRSTRRAAITLTGFLLVVVGLAGLLLPVLPGWLLIIGGFAVLSREYSWANSCLVFCRRQAAKNGKRLKTMAARRRRPVSPVLEVVLPDDDVVIDLTTATEHAPASESRRSQAL